MPKASPADLNARELLVLRFLTHSYSGPEIAGALGISRTAARDMVAQVVEKLTRAERAETASRLEWHNAAAAESRYRH